VRIVFVTLFYPPERNAGTENYTHGLATELASRGHDVHVVCATDWETGAEYWNGVSEERSDGVQIHRLRLNWTRAQDPNRVLYDSPEVQQWMERLLRSLRPDLVHATSLITLGVGAMRAARQQGVPLVLTLMDFWFLCPRTILVRSNGDLCDGRTTPSDCRRCLLRDSRLARTLENLLPDSLERSLWSFVSTHPALSRLRGARGTALNMEHRKAVLAAALEYPSQILAHSRYVQQSFPNAPVRRLLNGHDLRWLEDYRPKPLPDRLRIGYLGQLEPLKGVDLLVDAFRLAAVEGDARLDVWGGPARNESYRLLLESKASGRQDIELHGRFERGQLAEILADMDVLVVPSRWYENAPLVIQEAFAARVPVIAADLGGMAEAVTHEQDGLLFPHNDAEGLACQIRRLVDEPDLLPRLKTRIQPVKTIAQEVSELEEIYAGLVDAAAGADSQAQVEEMKL